jgi:hypothetical protein
MSTSVLVAKERQPGSPFDLGQKQAKNKKIRRKCATVARYSILYRFLCNTLQRASQKTKKYGANAPQLRAIRCFIDFCVMQCNETAFNPVRLGFRVLLLCAVPQQQSVRPQFITLRLLAMLALNALFCYTARNKSSEVL